MLFVYVGQYETSFKCISKYAVYMEIFPKILQTTWNCARNGSFEEQKQMVGLLDTNKIWTILYNKYFALWASLSHITELVRILVHTVPYYLSYKWHCYCLIRVLQIKGSCQRLWFKKCYSLFTLSTLCFIFHYRINSKVTIWQASINS